ncbi:MAG: glutathione S-transferase family protein [Deltaproteobacteria bacterium]|jgi:glutathione S-transferase|nr:glutathione S-transferase family protein [Deltaproteobacteria bacterium]
MLKLYHSKQSRSMRVVWLCEEIGLPYELEHLAMFTPEMKTPDYLAIHPLGKVPAIDDEGFVLWETAAIFEYLVSRYSDGTLLPARETREGAQAVQWMTYGENPLTVIMGEIAAHGGPIPDEMRIPALVDRGRAIAPALVNVVERALDGRTYILGEEFSAADIMLGFGLNIARHLGFVGDDTPRSLDYCERLMARPAYQRAAAV